MKSSIKSILPNIKFSFLIISGILFTVFINSCSTPKNNISKGLIPLLIITDFGRDVDDAQAFAYLANNINLQQRVNKEKDSNTAIGVDFQITGVIATGYIPQIRAKSLELFLNLYGISVPIAIGEPEKTNREIKDYLGSHTINGKPYELSLMEQLGSYQPNTELWRKMQDTSYILKYTSPDNLIDSLLSAYPRELRVVVLAQATQLAKYITKKQQNIKESKTDWQPKFHSIYIQGQCDTLVKGVIKPDFAAYNLREDIEATNTLFELQNIVPFIFLSKHAAYPLAFTKEETEEIGKTGYAGDYLKNGAYMGLQSFLERDSATFYKVFKSSNPDSLKVVNNPYDLLTVIAIDKPELFIADTIYIGDTPHILIDKHNQDNPKQKFYFW